LELREGEVGGVEKEVIEGSFPSAVGAYKTRDFNLEREREIVRGDLICDWSGGLGGGREVIAKREGGVPGAGWSFCFFVAFFFNVR